MAALTLATDTFIYSGTELDAMAQARNYCHWILRYFSPYLGPNIVEIGAGAGTFSQLLLDQPATTHLVLFESAANLCPVLRKRFGDQDDRVSLHCSTFNPSVLVQGPDSVVLVNVLEHVYEDQRLLLEIHESLRKGGSLLLFVPGFQWNYGSLDEAFGHHRRYGKSELRQKIERAGFQMKELRYVNFMGMASWFLAGKLLRQTTISSSQVRWYDRWIIPWSFAIEHICPPWIGQSLLAVALK